MLDTGPPRDHEDDGPCLAVSPLISRSPSASSTPEISFFDGTPLHLLPFSLSSSGSAVGGSSHGMAIGTRARSISARDVQPSAVKATLKEARGTQVETRQRAQLPVLPRDGAQEVDNASVLSLLELTALTRSEQYQRRRCHQVQQHLSVVNIAAIRTTRLILAAQSIQRTLAECVRAEDKHSFVNLFNAFHDALSDCPTLPSSSASEGSAMAPYPSSFLDALPVTSQGALLAFVAKVRSDGIFISNRLAALSHKELMGLLPDKGLSKAEDSIFGSPQRTSSHSSRHLGYVVDAQTELLASCELASPLDVLIHAARASSDIDPHDDHISTNAWATVCSRFVAEQRPGSEKLVAAVIDTWASSCKWPGKARLETWLLCTLQRGAFLLDQSHRHGFTASASIPARPAPPAEDYVQREAFYSEAVDSLLRLLVDMDGPSVVPPGALTLCRAIWTNLQQSPALQRAFPNFAITRWLFPSFLLNAINLPEAYGMLTDCFVSNHARQIILREIGSRCHKAVFDVIYSCKLGNVPSGQNSHFVRSLAERLSGQIGDPRSPLTSSLRLPEDRGIVVLSASDVQTMVNALYPAPVLPSLSDRDSAYSGLHSSASSVSGFSLFQAPSHADMVTSDMQGLPTAHYIDPLPSALPSSTSADPFVMTHITSDAESEGEHLREICTAIDEVLSRSRKESAASDNWSVLVPDAADRQLRSLHSVQSGLLDVSDAAKNPLKCTEILRESCQTTIADLLLEGDLLLQQDLSELKQSMSLAQSLGTTIVQALRHRISGLEDSMDLVQAQLYHIKLRQIRQMADISNTPKTWSSVLDSIATEKQRSLDNALLLISSCDALFRAVRTRLDRNCAQLRQWTDSLRHLRDKMWYIADVRTSASYDGLRAVVAALATMGKPQKLFRTRLNGPLRASSSKKVSITNYHLKSETQILEVLTAPAGYGGRSKFGDDQAKALAAWMETNAIENLCRGEERIHKLTMEVQRVTDLVTRESSTLITGDLFARDHPHRLELRSSTAYSSTLKNAGRSDLLALYTNMPLSIDAMPSVSSHACSAASSRDYLNHWSPSTTNRSSMSTWSSIMTEERSPSSITSVDTSPTQSASHFTSKLYSGVFQSDGPSRSEVLRQNTTSLLLSDVASPLFVDGSETDQAFWAGLGGELALKYLGTIDAQSMHEQDSLDASTTFNFDRAFARLTRRFSVSCNPYEKLQILLDLDSLLGPYMESAAPSSAQTQAAEPPPSRVKGMSAPSIADIKVKGFRCLFSNEATRPVAIFRDLQYIAALVPSQTLGTTRQGKAFWHAAVAISGLKESICKAMVETADSIIAYHSNKRGHGRSSSLAQRERDSAAFSVPNRSPSPEDVSGRTMSDAALLLQITAREGDAVAQRELATLYLTHPELMDHILAPFSRPRDVFKEELESKWRKNQDPTRCDPTTMCVAHHWMSLSSKGGDALAMEFLRQREEMERLP